MSLDAFRSVLQVEPVRDKFETTLNLSISSFDKLS